MQTLFRRTYWICDFIALTNALLNIQQMCSPKIGELAMSAMSSTQTPDIRRPMADDRGVEAISDMHNYAQACHSETTYTYH